MSNRRTGTAAAAILLIAASLALWWMLRRLGPPAGPPAIHPVTPAVAEMGRPLLLAWEGGGPPFEVSLLQPSGEVLWRSDALARPLVALPDAIREGMRPGLDYAWCVEGIDGRGRPFRSASFPLTLVAGN